MLLVLCQFALAEVSKTVVLVVLAEVKAYTLALDADTHWNEAVDEPIAKVAHAERIDEYDDDGEKVVQEDDKAVPRTGDKAFPDEDTRHYGTDNTAGSVRREHVEGIVDTTV